MSHALLRRNSSKQGLQNLMRLTAQRSIEDAEEIERERRRRAREDFRRRNSGSAPEESSPENETLAVENLYSSDLKPSCSPSLEEDEGFSDWTQRRERRRQQRLQELSQGGEEEDEEDAINKPMKSTRASFTSSGQFQRQQQEEEEEEDAINKPIKTTRASFTSSGQFQRQQQGEEEEEDAINKPIKTTRASFTSSSRFHRQQQEEERDRNRKEEEDGWATRAARERKEKEEEEEKRKQEMKKRREEIQKPKSEVEKRKEVKVSYTSKVFLHQEPKHDTKGDASNQEVTPHISKTRASTSVHSRTTEPEESQAILETEQRLEKIRRSLQAKESQEMEQLRHRQLEAEQELEKLQRRREERRRIREEEERRREEEEQQRLVKEEEERRQMKEDIERRRMEAAERMKSLSTSSVDGDEAFSPISPKAPTHKISERTESLNRSLKKSNSFKKMQPLLLTAKIDDKLEQYAHAVENSQEARAAKASLTDLPSSPEVASKKNLFEAGEAWNQSPTKPTTCKDTEGLKVGVAGLITQWVKGPSDTSRQPPCKPADVKSGDVMQKKNMWEIIGDATGRPGQGAKGSAGGKKYKFVITGHGKYEKIPVDEENGGQYTNGKSDLFHTDF